MLIQVKIIPRSSLNKVEETSPAEFKVHLTAPPVDNKANKLLISLLAKHFDVPKQAVIIRHGATKRQKLIEIMDK